MKHVLQDGDTVRVKPLSPSEVLTLPSGTLILFLRRNVEETIVHRLVGKGPQFVFERADRSRITRRLKPEEVIGNVTHVRREGRIRRIGVPLSWRLREFLTYLRISR